MLGSPTHRRQRLGDPKFKVIPSYTEFEDSLGYMRPLSKEERRVKRESYVREGRRQRVPGQAVPEKPCREKQNKRLTQDTD